jgi:hypothetical protein
MTLYMVSWEDGEWRNVCVVIPMNYDRADVIQAVREAAEQERPGIGITKIVRARTNEVHWRLAS